MNTATIAAVYAFAAHHHSGLGSRGYRLLCRAGRAWRRHTGVAPRLDYWESLVARGSTRVARIYRELEAAGYGDRL